jgi:BirA family biotin operon repressor/biotin-[acetyl-CoA-carboxylase] ligase
MSEAPLGNPRLHLRQTDSTNLRARTLAVAGAPHGTLVTANEQSAGRGRQGRGWSAPAGRGLLMSVVLRDPPSPLALIAGVAVAEVAQATDAQRRVARVKWPNDVLLDGRKVAGILVESRPQERWAVLGIGLNVALTPSMLGGELIGRAASLGLEPAAVEDVLVRTLVALEACLSLPTERALEEWQARDALHGRAVSWAAGSGTAAGIDAAGRLLVDTRSGTVTLEAGEVHLS